MIRNEVRIIGGKWKGRKLAFPGRAGLRPTLGRVRETLFNWLQGHVAGARCLDLFAGSGALGFEALSRGAAAAVFVERDRAAADALRANAQRLGALEATVVQRSARAYLAHANAAFDIVLLDPPFGAGALDAVLRALAQGTILAPGAIVYFETSRRGAFDTCGFEMVRDATAGETRFGLLAGS